MKKFVVYYFLKHNRTETMCNMVVEADNAKEACKKCKEMVKTETGKNAFRPTTKKPE